MVKIHSWAMYPFFHPGNTYWFKKNPENIHRGDVVIYTDSSGKNYLVSRVIAFSGDTVHIENGELISPSLSLRIYGAYDFYVHVSGNINPERYFQSKNLMYSTPVPDSLYVLCCDCTEINLLKKRWKNLIVERKMHEKEDFSPEINKKFPGKKWNKDFFGPYGVPYDTFSGKHEKKTSFSRHSDVLYFLMNDNRDHALDSRYTGCIRKYQILGKYVW